MNKEGLYYCAMFPDLLNPIRHNLVSGYLHTVLYNICQFQRISSRPRDTTRIAAKYYIRLGIPLLLGTNSETISDGSMLLAMASELGYLSHPLHHRDGLGGGSIVWLLHWKATNTVQYSK